MFVCVEHQLLSRRLAAPSLSFHAPSCGNIIRWIRTVDLFLLCPHFISSLSSFFMAFNLSAPPPSPPVFPVYPVSLAVVWLTTHKVVSGEVGNQTQLIWDLHRVTVVPRWTNTLINAHWLDNTPVFYCFNFPPLVPSLPPLTSYAIWSVDQYLNRLLYCIHYRWASSSTDIFRLRALCRFFHTDDQTQTECVQTQEGKDFWKLTGSTVRELCCYLFMVDIHRLFFSRKVCVERKQVTEREGQGRVMWEENTGAVAQP